MSMSVEEMYLLHAACRDLCDTGCVLQFPEPLVLRSLLCINDL